MTTEQLQILSIRTNLLNKHLKNITELLNYTSYTMIMKNEDENVPVELDVAIQGELKQLQRIYPMIIEAIEWEQVQNMEMKRVIDSIKNEARKETNKLLEKFQL
jgi:hypothetical protein